jgi:hydroxymethylbilane synthase
LEGTVVSLDGRDMVRSDLNGDLGEAEEVGIVLAEKLIKMGAGEILSKMRQEIMCDE